MLSANKSPGQVFIAVFIAVCLAIIFSSTRTLASDLENLAECSINVFKEIAKTQKWSGHTEGCAKGKVVVEKRTAGAFITTWKLVKNSGSWTKLALSSAVGYGELVDKKQLDDAIKDVKNRTMRLKKCLDSIQEVNDPGECRDTAKKIYSAGDVIGVDMERTIWLDDGGRHVVLGFSYGNSSASDTIPVDLEKTPALPAGMRIDLHQGLPGGDSKNKAPAGPNGATGKNK